MDVKEYDKIILSWLPEELDRKLKENYKEFRVVQAVPIYNNSIVIILERERITHIKKYG